VVKQVDRAGNSGEAVTRTWTTDTTAPDAPTVSDASESPVHYLAQTFTFSGENGASFECRVDDGDYAACTSPQVVTSTVPSDPSATVHRTFSVRQVDAAGNRSAEITREWTYERLDDTEAPAAPVVSGIPTAPTVRTTATVTITGEDNATFKCSLDGAAYAVCASPVQLTGLAIGDHVLLVTQTDQAGNTSPAASAEWTVLSRSAAAPTLLAKVQMRVNLKTKVTSLTLKARADRSKGSNAIKWIEYWNHTDRPAADAPQKPKFLVSYAATVQLKAGQVAFWIRIKDTKGKWSGWYRTRFKPGSIGW
jgi:hypothetical protein